MSTWKYWSKETLGADALATDVHNIALSVRVRCCLEKLAINYVGELVVLREAELLRQPNFGRKSLREVNEMLAEAGLQLGMKMPENVCDARTVCEHCGNLTRVHRRLDGGSSKSRNIDEARRAARRALEKVRDGIEDLDNWICEQERVAQQIMERIADGKVDRS